MLESRSCYGENVNRWYLRGLKPLPREFTWSRPSGFGRGLKNRIHSREHAGTVRARRDGVSVHAPEAISIAMLKRKRPEQLRRSAGKVSTIGAVLEGLISGSPVIAPARSAGASSVTGFRNTRALHGEGLSDDEGRAMRSAASPSMPGDRSLNSIKGTGYSSSSHLVSSEFEEWAVRAASKARKLGRIDDG